MANPSNFASSSGTAAPYSVESRVADDNDDDDDDSDDEDEDESEKDPRVDSPITNRFSPTYSSSTLPVRSNLTSQAYSTYQVNTTPQNSQYMTSTYASSSAFQPSNPTNTSSIQSSVVRPTIAILPPDVQANLDYLNRRFIQTGPDQNVAEPLDSRKASTIFMLTC